MWLRFHLLAALLPVLSLADSLPTKTLDQLAPGTWLENIAVRPNGDLLVTQLWPCAKIYTIHKPAGRNPKLKEIISLPKIQSLYGIAQVPLNNTERETYVFVGSEATAIGAPVVGSFAAWALDFDGPGCDAKTEFRKISIMNTDSAFLNGVAAIPGNSDAVLVADSANALVGRLDLKTGGFNTTAFVYPEMAPVQDAALPIGVNGIHVYDGSLYWTNSFEVSLYRIAITPDGYPCEGAQPALIMDLSDLAVFLDDFTFDSEGNIYVTSNFDNKIIHVNPRVRTARVVVGAVDSLTVAGDTAVAFGRGKYDKDVLYVTTSGGLAAPVDGKETEGSKVVAVDTCAYD